MNTGSKRPAYDRQLLLTGAKRNAVLDLTEVQRYGTESWGDPDYVCIYGLQPPEWPLLVFMLVVMAVGAKSYKRTLD